MTNIETLFKETGVGAIPETNEYANGWNDCRKRCFEELKKKQLALTSFEKEVREDEKNKVLNFVNSVQIATDKSMEMQKELLRKTKKPILSVGDEKDLNELAEWVFKLTKERYLKGFIDGSDLTGRLAQESKHEQQS